MPEGVEVFTLTNSLNRKCKGMNIKDFQIVSGRYKKHGSPVNTKVFKKDLPITVKKINSRGKFIWIETNSDWTIYITLGMTGFIRTREIDGNLRYILKGSKCTLYFYDDRNFGTIKFCDSKEELKNKLSKLGQDPLRDKLSFNHFEDRLMKYNENNTIADAMLDQRVIAGIGTYLRSEILYYARQNPFTKVRNMSQKDLTHLLKSIKHIMNKFLNSDVEFSIYGRDYTDKGQKIKYKKMKNDRGLYYI